MKAANVLDANGNKVARIKVFWDGYQLTEGFKGYKFYQEYTGQFSQSTIRKHAIESARMYMSDESVTITRLTEIVIK
jgi:hypothetical protein